MNEINITLSYGDILFWIAIILGHASNALFLILSEHTIIPSILMAMFTVLIVVFLGIVYD